VTSRPPDRLQVRWHEDWLASLDIYRRIWLDGGADVAETTYTPFSREQDAVPVRLIVRRVRPTPGSQLALLTLYDHHAFITDRAGSTVELEADHRRHAEVENAIRDLKYGVGLNHLPSGRFDRIELLEAIPGWTW
jgi:hypothetical protein